MSAAQIWTWRENPLPKLLTGSTIKAELDKTLRQVFVPAIVVQIYNAPFHRIYEHDEMGQWQDDGGK